MAEPTPIFYVKNNAGQFVTATILTNNGTVIVDPNTQKVSTTPIFSTLYPNDTLSNSQINPQNGLIVPVSYSISSAQQFAASVIEIGSIAAAVPDGSDPLSLMLAAMGENFVAGGGQDLQRNYNDYVWNFDAHNFVGAFTDAASFNLGFVAQQTNLGVTAAIAGGGALKLFSNSFRDWVDNVLNGQYGNPTTNYNSINLGAEVGAQLSNPQTQSTVTPLSFLGDNNFSLLQIINGLISYQDVQPLPLSPTTPDLLITNSAGSAGGDSQLSLLGSSGPLLTIDYGKSTSSNLAFIPPGTSDTSGYLSATGTTAAGSQLSATLAPEADGAHVIIQSGTTTVDLTPADLTGIDSAGSVGSYIGGQLAQLVVGNNAIANLATTTALSTAGEIIAQETSSQYLHGEDLTTATIADDFITNATNAIGGFAGAIGGAALFSSLGVNPVIGQIVGGTVGAAVASYAVAELAPEIGLTTTLSTNIINDLASGLPSAGLSAFEELTGFSPEVNAFNGSPQDVQIGSAIGGLIGIVLSPEIPIVGTFIGTVVGQFLGSLVGSLFGETSVGPNASNSLGLVVGSSGKLTFGITQQQSDNDSSGSLIKAINGLGSTVVALLNAEVTVVGGTIEGTSNTVPLRLFQNQFWDDIVTPGNQNFPNYSTSRSFGTDYSAVLNDAVIRQLALTTIESGDPNLSLALNNSLLSYDVNYVADASTTTKEHESISQLNYDLQAEQDYENYEQNKVAFLVGYALRDSTGATTDWDAEFARAALLQRVNVYGSNLGSVSYNYFGTHNIGNEGMLILSPSIEQSDVSVSRSGNDLVLSVDGNQVTIQAAFAQLTNTLGLLQLTNSDGTPGTNWSGIELEALLPAGSTASIPLLSIERISGSTITSSVAFSSSYVLLDGSDDTITLTGSDDVVGVIGATDSVTLLGAGNVVHLGNEQVVTVDGGETTVTLAGINSTLTMNGDNENVVINGNNVATSINGQNAVLLANGQQNILTLSGNDGTITANGDSATLTVAGSNEIVTANGSADLVALNVSGVSTLQMASGSVSLTNGTEVTIDGLLDTIAVVDADEVTIAGGQMTVSVTGGGDNLLLEGDTENLTLTGTAEGDTAETDGNGGSFLVAGGGNTVTLKGTNDTLSVTGSGNQLIVDGSRANVVNLSNYNNVLTTAGTFIDLADSSGATINGGGSTIDVGNSDVVTLSGDGDTLSLTGGYSTVNLTGGYAALTLGGQGNVVSLTGTSNSVTLSGQSDTLELLGADTRVSVSGASQDIRLSGGVVSIAAGSSALFDGTDHGGSGADDGNGNIIDLAASDTLTVTGSNNWVAVASGDTLSFTDNGNGVGATGTADTVSFASTGDYALMNDGAMNLAAGAQASLTGAANFVTMGTGATLSVMGVGTNRASFTFKGFAFDSYQNGEFQTATSASSLQALAATGANSVELVVTQYTPNLTNPTIAATADTESDASLEQAITDAQQDGLQVLLKPQVDPADGTYRALYDFSDHATFFANYQAFIVHYAEIAQANHVGMLSLGSELTSMTGSQYRSEWLTIIAAVRQVYSGELTYASAYNETATVSFWDKVDVIGVNPYEALTTTADPTVAQLDAGWTSTPNAATGNEAPATFYQNLAAQYGKQILFTETGYRSVNGTNTLDGQNGAYNAATYPYYPFQDYQQQSNALEAFFETFGEASWVAGADLWEWNPNPAAVATDDFSVQGKPALNVVDAWFGATGAVSTTGANQVNVGSNDTVVDNAGDNSFQISGSGNQITLSFGDTVTYHYDAGYEFVALGTGSSTIVLADGITTANASAGTDSAGDIILRDGVYTDEVTLAGSANSGIATIQLSDGTDWSTAGLLQVVQLYEQVLGRQADAGGAIFYAGLIADGSASPASVVQVLAGSDEAAGDIANLFEQVLYRAGTSDELASYQALLAEGVPLATIRTDLATSAEATADFSGAYQSDYGVAPSAGTLASLEALLSNVTGEHASGASIVTVADFMSVEAQAGLPVPQFISVAGANPVLTGSAGAAAGTPGDVFSYNTENAIGNAVIEGYNPAADFLFFDLAQFPAPSLVLAVTSNNATGSAVIQLDPRDSITLTGVPAASLTSQQILLA